MTLLLLLRPLLIFLLDAPAVFLRVPLLLLNYSVIILRLSRVIFGVSLVILQRPRLLPGLFPLLGMFLALLRMLRVGIFLSRRLPFVGLLR